MKINIHALVLDFGGVISEPQNAANIEHMLLRLGLAKADFQSIYFAKRGNYDRGKITGVQYWQGIGAHFGLRLESHQIKHLIREDVMSWTRINPNMVEFIEEIRAKVARLAVLSNMNPDSLAYLNQHCPWLAHFDARIYSCHLGVNKPDPRIYQRCLDNLQQDPEKCLFVDDTLENIQGAQRLGFHTILFKNYLQFKTAFENHYSLI